MNLTRLALAATLILSPMVVFAQAPATTTPPPTINQRKENQQDRIAQGVKSGQLTAGETAHLENKEAAVNKEVSAERTLNGRKLPAAEKREVKRPQNRLSRQIYTDKHNGAQQ